MKEYSFYMGNHNAYSVTPISDRVVRIRYNATGVFKETLMERYDIIEHPSIEVESSFADAEGEKSIIMRDVAVRFSEDASFSLEYRKNKVISRVIPFHPQEDLGVGGKITVRDNERFYGCGYRPQKGIELRGSIIKNWCAPVTNNGPSPFFISSGGWGLFFNNTRETFFDFAKRESDKLVFWSADGEFDIYVFFGDFKEIISDYTSLTGKPSLMPLNGYGITVVNNESENEISLIDKAERLRKEKIPCDNFSISCEWMDSYYDKSVNQKFNTERYFVHDWMHEHNTFIAALKHFGIKCTLWTPCEYDLTFEQERIYKKKHPNEDKTPLYQRAVRKSDNSDMSIDANSKLFWDDNLFPTVRHDPYTIPEEAWFEHFKRFFDLGIVGLAEDGHRVEIVKLDHFYANGYSYKEMHNLNQTLNSLQYFEGYKEYKNKRIFVRTPSTFVGHQKYCGTWCGDTTSDTSLVGLMQYSFQGQSNVTADMISTSPEQIHAGMFMPWVLNFCWGHPVWPWMLDDDLRNIYVDYANLRYALMPYIYTAAYNSHVSGIPMCSAMIINYPTDERYYDCYNQYMFGDSMLVSALTDEIHLPEGKWIDYWSGKEYDGLSSLKGGYPSDKGGYLFVKRGSIIPLWENVQYVKEEPVEKMTVRIYPDLMGEYTLYEDDGISFDFEKGVYAKTKISYTCTDEKITVSIERTDGSYKLPENREYNIEIYTSMRENLSSFARYDSIKGAITFKMHSGESVTV